MGSGGVAIAALPTVICLKVPFSDGLGGGKLSSYSYDKIFIFKTETTINATLLFEIQFFKIV